MKIIIVILFLVFGLCLNYNINVFLKEWIKEPLDPIVFPNRKKNKYGNPSGHAQFYSFLFFFFLLFPMPHFYVKLFMLSLIAFFYLKTIYVCLTRGYHTPKQLLFGTFMGFVVCFSLYTCFQLLIKSN